MRRLIASLALLLSLAAESQAQDGADIRVLVGRDDAVWVGERVDIHLELWTDALSFSGLSFSLPVAEGGYLLPADSSTINMSERRGHETWQGLRYTFSLYPQRPGEVVVPAFDVRFSTRAGYGSEPKSYDFRTQPLSVRAELPPGVEGSALLVTTTEFSLDAAWEPVPDEEGVLELMTGDALVLTVKREAGGVPGMVFAPLPDFETDGLGVYTDPPAVNDRVHRGDLTGTRTDRITLICESPGRYELPGLDFQWWDPRRERLNEESVPGLVVEVAQNPAWAAAPAGGEESGQKGFDWRFLWLAPVALLLWWPVWPLARAAMTWLREEFRARRLEPLNPRGTRE